MTNFDQFETYNINIPQKSYSLIPITTEIINMEM